MITCVLKHVYNMYVYIYTCVSIYIYTIQGAFHPFLVSFLPMVQSFEDPNCTWNLGQLAQQRTVGFQGCLLLLHLAPLDWKWDCEDLRKRHTSIYRYACMHEASDRKTFFSSARWQFVRCCKKAIDFRIWIFLQETPIFNFTWAENSVANVWKILCVFHVQYFAGSFKFTGRHSEFERRGKIRGWRVFCLFQSCGICCKCQEPDMFSMIFASSFREFEQSSKIKRVRVSDVLFLMIFASTIVLQ